MCLHMFMMKPTYLTIASIISFAVCAPAAEPESPISNEAVRAAIATFRQNPLSPEGRAAGEVVRSFAEKTDTVVVQMSDKVTPFVNNPELLTADRTLLRNAFIVGNVDSQLSRKERKDDPYAGVSEVIHTYREMQKRNPTLKLAGIENFIDLEKHGELKTYVNSP
jgi:hypothetical protein